MTQGSARPGTCVYSAMQQPSTSMLKSTLPMNVSATLNLFRLIRDPSLCLPQATISTFNHLPIPVSKAFVSSAKGKEPDIRAVVLDKDNCFAWPKENTVYKPYNVWAISFLCFTMPTLILLHNMSIL